MNFLKACLALLLLSAAVTLPLRADSYNYTNIGQVAPEVATYAKASGGIHIYFAGSTASFTDTVQIVDLSTG